MFKLMWGSRGTVNKPVILCLSVITYQTHCGKGGGYSCARFATALDLLWCAACYGHPYPSHYLQCASGFVCCQTACLTVAMQTLRPRFCCQNGRWRSHPSFVCCQTVCLSVAIPLVSVARFSDGGANPLFVCCHFPANMKHRPSVGPMLGHRGVVPNIWSISSVCRVLVKLITKKEVNISAQTCYGMLHVLDTRRIYSVTVVMPRSHVKIIQRDLEDESHVQVEGRGWGT